MSEESDWGLRVVARRSATDQVLLELRTAILTGRIKPDEQLRETGLARAFGTGRSAIREALRYLVAEGLATHEINRGVRVRSIEIADVLDVYRARSAIEVAAVRLVGERDRAVDLTELRTALRRIRQASPPEALEAPSPELIAADIDFHRAMVALAGSPRLSRAHEPLAAESQMLLNWHPVYQLSDYTADHQELLDAIEAHDPAAGEVVRRHLELSADLIVQEARRYGDRLADAGSLVGHDGPEAWRLPPAARTDNGGRDRPHKREEAEP